MPIETITFKGKEYPKFQSEGNAARWILEFAKQYCIGNGVDVGCNRAEWTYPGALPIDLNFGESSAMNFPKLHIELDYIFSSHMLEHFAGNWMTCLDYWLTKIKIGGIIFLYLPHKSQEYWLPENNRKHIHSFSGDEIEAYLLSLGHKVIKSGVDLNNSFVVVCERVQKEPEYGAKV